MTVKNSVMPAKKRKKSPDNPVAKEPFSDVVGLEMSSDEEGQFDSGPDDGEVDDFPGIDTSSDSELDASENGEDLSSEDEEADLDSDSDMEIFPKAKTIISSITGQQKRVYPEIEPDYDSDSSTEDVRSVFVSPAAYFQLLIFYQTPNRVGNVPMHWYDDLPHVGYTVDGKKVLRPARGDELDKFLQTVEDPSSWWGPNIPTENYPLSL